jgi:hypothetical protein
LPGVATGKRGFPSPLRVGEHLERSGKCETGWGYL